MNPFDLRGPEFLAFFACLMAVVLLAIWKARGFLESEPTAQLEAGDPYQLAFLRDGPEAAVEVALLSLIDRGVLVVEKPEGAATDQPSGKAAKSLAGQTRIVQSDPRAVESLRRTFEKQVFLHFAAPAPTRIQSAIRSLARSARETYEEGLERIGLLASPATFFLRAVLAVAGIAALWLVATNKISIAKARGHSNIWFLVSLAVLGSVLCMCLIGGRITVAGRKLVRSLQGLFGRLKHRSTRIERGGASNELSMLAALYGLDSVSATVFPHSRLIRRPEQEKSKSSCSSCGTTAGSSCGSGGGSSCGGGGGSSCGGGGCGGCGS